MNVRKDELEYARKVIADAATEIMKQDNRITSDPIFMVQERRETFDEISGEETASYRHNLQPFFTEKAAKRYIRENKHNLSSPRIYVESGYRNREWIAVRTLLKDISEKAEQKCT